MATYAIAGTKGGLAKSTLSLCLAHSEAFRKAYGSVALVELDPQGSLAAWRRDRANTTCKSYFYHLNERTARDGLSKALEHDAVILDVPGESKPGFMTRLALGAADVIVLPMRASGFDEHSLGAHVLPVLRQVDARFVVLPVFVHPNASLAKLKAYFDAILPDGLVCLDAVLPARTVYQDALRDGLTLRDYRDTVQGNRRACRQVDAAIADIEHIAEELIRATQNA
ncbi:MAG: ParA family protein [bacterium]|nr:ParA family protein [bacterium]